MTEKLKSRSLWQVMVVMLLIVAMVFQGSVVNAAVVNEKVSTPKNDKSQNILKKTADTMQNRIDFKGLERIDKEWNRENVSKNLHGYMKLMFTSVASNPQIVNTEYGLIPGKNMVTLNLVFTDFLKRETQKKPGEDGFQYLNRLNDIVSKYSDINSVGKVNNVFNYDDAGLRRYAIDEVTNKSIRRSLGGKFYWQESASMKFSFMTLQLFRDMAEFEAAFLYDEKNNPDQKSKVLKSFFEDNKNIVTSLYLFRKIIWDQFIYEKLGLLDIINKKFLATIYKGEIDLKDEAICDKSEYNFNVIRSPLKLEMQNSLYLDKNTDEIFNEYTTCFNHLDKLEEKYNKMKVSLKNDIGLNLDVRYLNNTETKSMILNNESIRLGISTNFSDSLSKGMFKNIEIQNSDLVVIKGNRFVKNQDKLTKTYLGKIKNGDVYYIPDYYKNAYLPHFRSGLYDSFIDNVNKKLIEVDLNRTLSIFPHVCLRPGVTKAIELEQNAISNERTESMKVNGEIGASDLTNQVNGKIGIEKGIEAKKSEETEYQVKYEYVCKNAK